MIADFSAHRRAKRRTGAALPSAALRSPARLLEPTSQKQARIRADMAEDRPVLDG
jgi:hypothetical protein